MPRKKDWVETVLDDGDWFGPFVDSVVRQWRSRLKKEAAIRANPTTKETGDEGEELVAERLRARQYTVEFADRSHTPADVYAYRIRRGGLVHVVLVQVKASAEGAPAALTSKEGQDLDRWTSTVFDLFRKSEVVPGETRDAPLIVSCGWAGVSLEDGTVQGQLVNYYFDKSLPEEARAFVPRFHEVL
jgi:hypothetical protein